MEKEIKMKLSPAWITCANMINAMFSEDKDIHIIYDNNLYVVKIYVDNVEKAKALDLILCWSKPYGNISLCIEVIPPNKEKYSNIKIDYNNPQSIYEIAFKGNPVFSFAKTIQGIFNNNITYIVFKNKVVQFFNDDLNDVYGNMTTLYEDIAREIFDPIKIPNKGVYYSTDVPDGLKKPLEQWP